MKVFKINDFICFKFHLLVSEKKYKIYSELIKENGGEVLPVAEDNVCTFTTEIKGIMRQDTYQLKYITDCIAAGKILDLGDYAWDRKKNYGCAMSLLMFGEKHCPCIDLLRKPSNRCADSPQRNLPPRISLQKMVPVEETIPKPSTSRRTESIEIVETPPKSRKAESPKMASMLNKPRNALIEPKIVTTLEKNEAIVVKKSIEKGKINHKDPDPKEVPCVKLQMENVRKKKEPEKRKVSLSINIDLRNEKETEEWKELEEKREEERKKKERKERLERKQQQEKKLKEVEEQERSKSPVPLKKPGPQITNIAKVVCMKLPLNRNTSDYTKSQESESNESFDKLQTQIKSKTQQEILSKRVFTDEDLLENLPLSKRCRSDDPIENQIIFQKNSRFRLDEGREDFQSLEDSSIQGRNTLKLIDQLQITSEITQNPSDFSQDLSEFSQNPFDFSQDPYVFSQDPSISQHPALFAEDASVYSQKLSRDSNHELFESEDFMTQDEFINQGRLENDEQIEEGISTDLEFSPFLTQVPMEVDDTNFNLKSTEKEDSNKSFTDELESTIRGLSQEINSHSQVDIQRGASLDLDKIQEKEKNKDRIQEGQDSKQEEEPSPLLDTEDLKLLQDDSETDFEHTTNSPMIRKEVDPDVEIIVKQEPDVSTLQSLQHDDRIVDNDAAVTGNEKINGEDRMEELSIRNNIEKQTQRIPKERKKKTSPEENSNDSVSDAETVLNISNVDIHIRGDLMIEKNRLEMKKEEAAKQNNYCKTHWDKFAESDSESPDFGEEDFRKNMAERKKVEEKENERGKIIEMKMKEKTAKKNFWEEFFNE